MPTNILSIQPQLNVDLVTFNNASWLDVFSFPTSGSAIGYASAGNIGNGSVTISTVAKQSVVGAYTLRVVEAAANGNPARFFAEDANGAVVGVGSVGRLAYAGGVSFIVAAGATAFVVGDSFTLVVLQGALDISDIAFTLTLRASLSAAQPALIASTALNTILNGGPSGGAAMRVPTSAMKAIDPGVYSYDLVGSADGFDVLAYQGSITHTQGVTVLPSVR